MEHAFLVAGLGNPGTQYARTRHNVGYLVADELLSRRRGNWQEKFRGMAAWITLGQVRCLLLKPTTFMNLSGQSVVRTARFYKILTEKTIIVHDDLDLPLGTVRVKRGGGTAGHNGLESCQLELGTENFLRVRIGIGRPEQKEASDYVLSNFTAEEASLLTEIIARGSDAVTMTIRRGPVAAMNEFNQRGGGQNES